MSRALCGLALLILCVVLLASVSYAAHPPTARPDDVIKAGEVLAQLNDWRALMFVMLFVIVVLLSERALAAVLMSRERSAMRTEMEKMRREQAEEREKMRAVASEFSAAADKVAESMNATASELTVLRAFVSRAEAIIGEVHAAR